ncbi:probable serine/threonine-protein kinase PBL12 [Phalaenopsis equestris]|uniref:probable serine/threonine-protein kinase PBL12 n=1 Tax=Phalaenopsis equestris TaxID=78828 RepID=UPI0009E593A4|nr:probable serine/threonine-protein kinase PBL12 [Phalaenopsis equestris]XP_020574181.1 probable serine/threonine-protein kinase PBL12 [Phalaenopsis equestris]
MVAWSKVDDEGRGEEKSIVVGVQIDGDGRELLGWAITNLAEEGDRLVAVNVCRNQDLSRAPKPSLIKFLDDCLTEHEDLCTKKKIILAGRVARGNSIKKALVREAEICSAKAVVVGANKNFSLVGFASLAKYCAKKLPSTIALIAVHKGKIIFERAAATKLLLGGQKIPNLRNFLHPSVGMDTEFIAPISQSKSGLKNPKLHNTKYRILNQTKNDSKDHCLLDLGTMRERNKSSISALVRKLPEQKLGWPLLRRSVAANIEALKGGEARKMSVIHWVMKLPDRSLASTHSQFYLLKELEIILQINSSCCKFFQYEELQNSTNYFSPENLIGKGGNSRVYKGCLSDGQQVAIKLSKLNEESSRDFLLEVDIVTRLWHDRVVPLIGICVEDNNLISVYSYFSRGNLEENLHDKRAKAALNWDKRFKVAIGVAEALSYLHDGCLRPVIHRDVKSSNILLSDEWKPQLSDFGLAIWAPTNAPYLTHSDVVGTFGYLAPEYFMYGKVSTKIDVYAFGVVLLELLTGRRPINDESPREQESLVMWATPILQRGDIKEIIDPNLDGKYEESQMKRMAMAAAMCIRRAACRRPHMRQVFELLRGEEEMMKPWMSCDEVNNNVGEQDWQEEEAYPDSSIGSHIGLALLDVDDDASLMSFEHNIYSLDEYFQNRWDSLHKI